MTNNQANVIHALLDAATEATHFQSFIATFMADGWTPEDIVEATDALARMSGMDNSFDLEELRELA